MAPTRPATPAAGVIALILVGGAIATAVAAFMMYAGSYQTDVLESFRHSTAYYVLDCALIGFFTAVGVMLTRPRGPLAPIAAAFAACVALYVGNRLGVLAHLLPGGLPGGGLLTAIMKYRFNVEDLVAPLVAGGVAGLRVLMVAGSLPPPAHPYQPAPGRPPVPPFQAPPPPPAQGWAPGGPQGGPQGGPPPHGGR